MSIGGYEIFDGRDILHPFHGYAGIIVYHYTDDEYLAYDLACPNDYQQGCKVEYFNGDLMLECPCCGTTFSIFDGFPRSNVDTYPSPLYKYGTSIGANRVVYIYN
jgi:nitrite reductase/ring-hydroxylating ferredoxin subunit